MLVSGTSPDGSLAEIIEIPAHPFYIAVQFHPEFLSKPNDPHPLFSGFVATALAISEADRDDLAEGDDVIQKIS